MKDKLGDGRSFLDEAVKQAIKAFFEHLKPSIERLTEEVEELLDSVTQLTKCLHSLITTVERLVEDHKEHKEEVSRRLVRLEEQFINPVDSSPRTDEDSL